MIIAEVCKYAPNYGGNFISSLYSVERFLKADDNNHEIIYVLPKEAKGKAWVTELQHSHQVFFLCGGRFDENLTLLKLCKKLNVDIMHVHFYGIISTFLVGWLCRTKIIHHFHNTLDYSSSKAFIMKYLAFANKKLIGCSKAVYDTLISSGFPSKKCSYITNCIDFSRFDTIQNNNPFRNEKRNLLILGTDFYRKGVDTALKAVDALQEEYNLCLQIVTHSPEQTKFLIEQSLGKFPEWVNLAPTTEYIGDYYRASEIFLSPSLNEGLCYAIPEALYCNCMVLKNDLPSLYYNLDGESFITIGLQQSLKERLEETLNIPIEKKELLINQLKKQVIDNFSVNKWGKEVFQMYKQIIKS